MTPELEARIVEAEHIARDNLRMDPGEIRFVAVPASVLYDAASTGLPGHWAHWSSGREYWQMKQGHDAGMSRIYEMVVNTRPYLALLHEGNSDINNVAVAAHVMGHTHINGNNVYFQDTNPKILDTVRLWAHRIEGYEEEHGDIVVEEFIDKVLSLEPYADVRFEGKEFTEPTPEKELIPDLFTPPVKPSVPPKDFKPTSDLFAFLAMYAEGLEEWQRDILMIYRQRAIYFQPMARSKVMHEGFAALTHRRIMSLLDTTDAEWIEYSDMNSGVLSPSPGRLNPYWLGHAVLEDIEKRDGWDAVLDAVSVEDDASLMRNHLTDELVEKLDLFTIQFHSRGASRSGREIGDWTIDDEDEYRDPERMRSLLSKKFSTFRSPTIEITGFDYDGKRGLHLVHRWDGRRLNLPYADAALAAIADIWQQRVVLSPGSRRDRPALRRGRHANATRRM